eukprot:scaffold228928_cov33-Attheya_sp.AAC.1
MVTRRPKRKRSAGLHRQGKHYNRETVEVLSEQIRAVYFLYGWGNGVGGGLPFWARLGFVRREFYVQKPSDEVLFHLPATSCYAVAVLGRRLLSI